MRVADRVTLIVDDALAIAERCWDAGLEVRVPEDADETTVVVIDPFGRELELISRTAQRERRARGSGWRSIHTSSRAS
jgi:hypothetical protein